MTCFICYKKEVNLKQDDGYLTTLCQSLQLEISIFQDLFNTSSIKVCSKCRVNLEKVVEIGEEIRVLQSYLNDVKKNIQADFVHSLQICEEKNHRSKNRRKIIDEINARLGQNAYPSQSSEQDIKIESIDIDINIDDKIEKITDIHNHTHKNKSHETQKAKDIMPNTAVTNLSDQMELDVIVITGTDNNDTNNEPQLLESQSQPQPTYIQEKAKYKILWKCRICSTTFDTEQNLKVHRETQHHSTTPCKTCSVSFKDIHMHTHEYLAHTGILTYLCYICDKNFTNLVEKNSHIVSEHIVEMRTGKKTKAYLMSVPVSKSKVTNDAMRIYPIPNPKSTLLSPKPKVISKVIWKCTLCLLIFDSLKDLQSHRMSSHKTIYVKCPTCKMLIKKEFLPYHVANNHDERNFKFPCHICHKRFKKGSEKDDHIVKEHMEVSNEVEVEGEVSVEKEKNLGVEETPRPKDSQQKDELLAEWSEMTETQPEDENVRADFQKTWKCQICPDLKIFKTSRELTNHRIQEHFLKMKCPICEELIFKRLVSQHLKYVHGTVPKKKYKYNCYICNQGFQDFSEKSDHILKEHKNENKNKDIEALVNEMVASGDPKSRHTKAQNEDRITKSSSEMIETHDVDIESQGTLEKEQDSIDDCSSVDANQNKKSATNDSSSSSNSGEKAPFLKSSTLKCSLCPTPKVFKTEQDLRMHRFREHFQKIKCPICELLICKNFLSKHMKDVHGSVPEKSYKYNCYVCNKAFQDFFEKSDHIVKEHPHINNEEMTSTEHQTPKPISDKHEDQNQTTKSSEVDLITTNVPIIHGKRLRGRPNKFSF